MGSGKYFLGYTDDLSGLPGSVGQVRECASRLLREAKARNIPTAAIVGAASLPTARSANVVLAASEHPSPTSGMIVISALIYILVEALHWSFSQRFSGAEQAIAELANRIREVED